MTDEQIIVELRELGRHLSASALARRLADMLPDGIITQSLMVTLFWRAFPEIPLRSLLDGGAWHRASGGGMTDDELDALLGPWLPRNG